MLDKLPSDLTFDQRDRAESFIRSYATEHRTTELHQQGRTELYQDFELVCKLGADTLNTSSNKLFSQGFELLASCDSMKCQNFHVSFDFNTSTIMNIVIFIVIVLRGSVVV